MNASDAGSDSAPMWWWQQHFAGRLTEHVFESRVLEGNPLCDPTERPLYVYVPPGYDESEERYPSVYVIQGYTGQAAMWWNRTAFREPFPAAADRLFASGEAPPTVVVYVDAWTAYGGSQFVDSPGTGLVSHLPVRGDRPVGRCALPHHGRCGAPGHPGEIAAGSAR